MSEATAFLEKANGPDKGRIIDLSGDRVSIGRTIDNDVVLASDHVSRCHAYLLRSRNGWHIQDNDSKNGVLVNGVLVRERQLAPGDVIQVGDQILRFNHPTLSQPIEPARPARSPSFAIPAPATVPAYTDPAGFSAAVSAYTAPFPEEKSRLPLYSMLIFGLFALAYLSLSREGTRTVESASAKVAAQTRAEPAVRSAVVETPPRAPEILPAREPAAANASVVAAVTKAPPPAPVQASIPAPPAAKPLTSGEVTKMDESDELRVYLDEGRAFLKKGDFASAASAFQIAIVIDPRNEIAMKGLRASEYQLRELDNVSLDSLPAAIKPKVTKTERRRQQKERKREVTDLLSSARASLKKKSYSEAIGFAEAARKIEVAGETAYLNEAKQIIDRARVAQKEEFDPFIKEARQKYEQGDYAGSRDLCDEMLKRDPAYQEAQECVTRAREHLERTAKQ